MSAGKEARDPSERELEREPDEEIVLEPVAEEAPTAEELAALRAGAAKAAEYLDLAQRAAADLQNLQHRLARERETARKLAVRDLVGALLPSFDNLERALAAADAGDPKQVIEGVRMVNAEIHRILADRGLEVIHPDGEHLDPNLHEAVFQRHEPGVPEGRILEVFEKGYRLGDLMIRPARVIVAAPPPRAVEAAESDPGDEDEPADRRDGF